MIEWILLLPPFLIFQGFRPPNFPITSVHVSYKKVSYKGHRKNIYSFHALYSRRCSSIQNINKMAWSSERKGSNTPRGSFLSIPSASFARASIDNTSLSPSRISSATLSGSAISLQQQKQLQQRAVSNTKRKAKKKEDKLMMRPFSPMYTNVNSCQVDNRYFI